MTHALNACVVLVVLATSQALILDDKHDLELGEFAEYSWSRNGDHIDDNSHKDSKPGTPVIPNFQDSENLPITGANYDGEWRAQLGERLVQAASAHDSMEKCGSFISMGDFTWCRKAMPKEISPAFKEKFRGVHEYKLNSDIDVEDAPSGDSFLALSFGVEETDCWSELMSSLYYVKSEIFDCYYNGTNGPLANDWHAGYSKSKPCQTRHCYTVDYKKNRICLDDTSKVQGGIFTDKDNRKYQSLFTALEGRAPLSTFLKMDIEGSEWAALEKLLEDDEQLAKIRTLDMEVHFNMQPQVAQKDQSSNVLIMNTNPTQKTLTYHVEIIERLAKKMAVTGSTLEHHTAALIQSYNQERKTNALWRAPAANVYTKTGLNLDQYCLSFINRDLL